MSKTRSSLAAILFFFVLLSSTLAVRLPPAAGESADTDADGDNLKSLHIAGATGAGVRVAVLDSGLAPGDPRFDNGGSGGITAIIDATDEGDLTDGVGHGTYTAGRIAGRDILAERSQRQPCGGVAPDAELIALRVFTSAQTSYTSWLLDAINYAMEAGATVISLSVGGSDSADEPFRDKVDEAVAAGITVVAAAGNDGPLRGTLNHPASQASVLSVGGLATGGDAVASFSSRGPMPELVRRLRRPLGASEGMRGPLRAPRDGREDGAAPSTSRATLVKPDIVAPAQDVRGFGRLPRGNRSSSSDRECVRMSGTSAAAPGVAGVVAGLQSCLQPGATRQWVGNPAAMKQAVTLTARRLGGRAASEQQFESGLWVSPRDVSVDMHSQGSGAVDAEAAAVYLCGELDTDAGLQQRRRRRHRHRRRKMGSNPNSKHSAVPHLEGDDDAAAAEDAFSGVSSSVRRRHPREGRVTALPPFVSFSRTDCPYALPHCAQPLWLVHGLPPSAFNITIVNSIGVASTILPVKRAAVADGEHHVGAHHAPSSSRIVLATWVPGDNGEYLEVTATAPELLWPWGGWLGVSVAPLPMPPRPAGRAAPRAHTWDAADDVVEAEGELVVTISTPVDPAKLRWLRRRRSEAAAGVNQTDSEPPLVLDDRANSLAPGGRAILSRLRIPVRASIARAPPPRRLSVLWDTAHSLGYPTSLVPRDDIATSSTAGSALQGTAAAVRAAAAAIDDADGVYDWHGDSPHSNYAALWRELRVAGFGVSTSTVSWRAPPLDLISTPTTSGVDISAFGAVLVVDPELEFATSEIDALVEAVVYRATTSLLLFADWWDSDVLASTVVRRHDVATGCDWMPVTGGSTLPAVNALLAPFGIALAGRVFDGELSPRGGGARVPYASGSAIARAPRGAVIMWALLSNASTVLLGGTEDEAARPVPVMALVEAGTAKVVPPPRVRGAGVRAGVLPGAPVMTGGRVAVFGDSACVDDAYSTYHGAATPCTDLVLAALAFLSHGGTRALVGWTGQREAPRPEDGMHVVPICDARVIEAETAHGAPYVCTTEMALHFGEPAEWPDTTSAAAASRVTHSDHRRRREVRAPLSWLRPPSQQPHASTSAALPSNASAAAILSLSLGAIEAGDDDIDPQVLAQIAPAAAIPRDAEPPCGCIGGLDTY